MMGHDVSRCISYGGLTLGALTTSTDLTLVLAPLSGEVVRTQTRILLLALHTDALLATIRVRTLLTGTWFWREITKYCS